MPQSRSSTVLPKHQKHRDEEQIIIKETRLCKYIENFTTKYWKSSDKNSDIFHISTQNIDCRYSLESPPGGGSNG